MLLLNLQQELAEGNLRGDFALRPDLLSTDKGLLDNTVEGPAHVRRDLVLELDDLLGDNKGLVRVPDDKVGIGADSDGALDAAQSDLTRCVETLPLGQILNAILSSGNEDERKISVGE